MKILKKIECLCVIILIVISLFSNVFAANPKTQLNVIKPSSEVKYLENDQGYVSKTIVDTNKDTGEVTIELKMSNTKKELQVSNQTEIVLVIDNSGSMAFKTAAGETRKSILLNAANNLVESIFNTSANVKVGIVKFYKSVETITELTNSKEEVLKGIEKIKNTSVEDSTNIQAGLERAESEFSKNAGNKIIVLLTDGCPNYDAKGNYIKDNQMVMTNATYNKILENTKEELINVKNRRINLISLMMGVSSDDVDSKGNVITSTEENNKAIEMIFGTETNPTVGKFYNVKTTDVDKVMKENITKDVVETINKPLNTIKFVDYFPKNITNNFEFSYVQKPNVGTSTDSIDATNDTIEWKMDTLKGGEVATLKYKLKIKSMQNPTLLNKTIATNDRVVITYKDADNKDYTVTLTDSPTIQLAEVEDIANVTNEIDNTVAKSNIPQTGMDYTTIIAVTAVAIIATAIGIKVKLYKDIK